MWKQISTFLLKSFYWYIITILNFYTNIERGGAGGERGGKKRKMKALDHPPHPSGVGSGKYISKLAAEKDGGHGAG